MDNNSLEFRLEVYRDRLKHHTDPSMIAYYKAEIEFLENEIEAETAVSKLLSETTPWEVTTNDIETVRELRETCKIFSIDRRWVWRHFDFYYCVKFLPRK